MGQEATVVERPEPTIINDRAHLYCPILEWLALDELIQAADQYITKRDSINPAPYHLSQEGQRLNRAVKAYREAKQSGKGSA